MGKKKSTSRRRVNQADYLETYIESLLMPVQPRAKFVGDLRSRLEHTPRRRRSFMRPIHYAVLAIISLVAGALLIVTGARLVATLLGGMGIARYIIQGHTQQRRSLPA